MPLMRIKADILMLIGFVLLVLAGGSRQAAALPCLAASNAGYGGELGASGSWGKVVEGARLHDEECNLVYNRARMLHPTLGRFMQMDPLGYVDGANDYQYQWSNSINGQDSLGLADNTSPWGTGWEWLTGTGPRTHNFGNGDPFTNLLRQHQHVKDMIDKVSKQLAEHCKSCDNSQIKDTDNYTLSGWSGVSKYLKDYSTLLTGGMTGNLAVTYLGSYQLTYSTTSIDCKSGTATLHIHVHNTSTIQSATHPPVIGYTSWWSTYIGNPLNKAFSTGPMSKTEQNFDWDEPISFTPNKCCKK